MTHTVHCQKLGKELAGLERAPYPGPLGQKIYNNISKQAWDLWISQQTMLINEYRLQLIDKEARQYLEKEMQRFLFTKDSTPPPGYKPAE